MDREGRNKVTYTFKSIGHLHQLIVSSPGTRKQQVDTEMDAMGMQGRPL